MTSGFVSLPLVLSLSVVALAGAAGANTLTIEFHPSTSRSEMLSCAIALREGQFTAVEFQGPGYERRIPARWYATEPDVEVFVDALQGLLAGDPSSVPDLGNFTLPEPPFAVVAWEAQMTEGTMNGLYLQPGMKLPTSLSAVVEVLLTGSRCAEIAAQFGG